MNSESQTRECKHHHTNSLHSYLATLSNHWGSPYVPVFFYPPRTVSCDGVCFSKEPVPQLYLARVRVHSTKKMSESSYPSDLPQCPGLLKCLHSDRVKERTRPSWMAPTVHVGDSGADTFVVDRTVFPYIPLTNLDNVMRNQNMLIPACALQVRRERGTEAQPLSVSAIRHVLRPLAETLFCLHRAGFAHNNVRPENVLISPDLAIYLHGIDTLPSTLCEHVRWRSPELAKLKEQTPVTDLMAGDVWAFGCVALYLSTLHIPFLDEHDSLAILSELQLLNQQCNPLARQGTGFTERVANAITLIKDEDLRSLLTGCITIDATKRLTIDRVKASPFFNCASDPYVPTTYGALTRSTDAAVSESTTVVDPLDAAVSAVTDVFSEETLGLTSLAITTMNAVLLSILVPIMEEESNNNSIMTDLTTQELNNNNDDVFRELKVVPALGNKQPLVALPLLELIREFPTACAVTFTVDGFNCTSDSELYQQCVVHAEHMLQEAAANVTQWSAEESKDYVPPSVGPSSSSASNFVVAGADYVFASDSAVAVRVCDDELDEEEEQESNVIESGILTLHDGNDGDAEDNVENIMRDLEAMQARNRRVGCMPLKRVIIIISVVMLSVVCVVVIVFPVVFARK